MAGDDRYYSIPIQLPKNVERFPTASQREHERKELNRRIVQDLSGAPADCARAVYLAICFDNVGRFRKEHPQAWAAGVAELKNKPAVLLIIF
jgi:hypothetical protein